ncbi:hypothetical protein D3C75_709460 [compost metagenome]
MVRFLTIQNVAAFFGTEFLLVFRVLIEDQPADGPDQAQDTGNDKRHFPAVGHNRPDHQRGSEHRAHRGSDVKVTHRDGALFGREPFATGFQPGRDHRRFGHTDRTTGHSQTDPAVGQRGAHTEDGPQDGKHRIADFSAEHVENIACNGLHQGIAGRIGGNNIGILLGRDPQ